MSGGLLRPSLCQNGRAGSPILRRDNLRLGVKQFAEREARESVTYNE